VGCGPSSFRRNLRTTGRYAQAVVQYEDPSYRPFQRKNAAVWVTRNYGDIATAMLSGAVCGDFSRRPMRSAAARASTSMPLPMRRRQRRSSPRFCGAIYRAARLLSSLTGSHGCDYSGSDPARSSVIRGSGDAGVGACTPSERQPVYLVATVGVPAPTPASPEPPDNAAAWPDQSLSSRTHASR